jgi:uncharacterized protein
MPSMNLTYIFLALTVIIGFFTKNKNFFNLCIIITSLIALTQGIISLAGAGSLLFFSIICYSYFNVQNLSVFVRLILFSLILIAAAGFAFHIMPGFYNILAIDRVSLSDLSTPFSMYLNFDKVMVAIILYSFSGLYSQEKSINKQDISQILISLIVCISIIFILSYLFGYIKFDPKLPSILGIWVLNNLLFVCMAEEVIFRGFIQKKLKSLLMQKTNLSYLHIIITALIFGLVHFKGGVLYIILAAISGLIYGYIYDKTNKISCALIVHFGLNLAHLIFFTYPFSITLI